VQLQFGGQAHFITAEKQQILDLLTSTYEGAVQINEEPETIEFPRRGRSQGA
jgi:two-component system sensor histidine kinase/response regulator